MADTRCDRFRTVQTSRVCAGDLPGPPTSSPRFEPSLQAPWPPDDLRANTAPFVPRLEVDAPERVGAQLSGRGVRTKYASEYTR